MGQIGTVHDRLTGTLVAGCGCARSHVSRELSGETIMWLREARRGDRDVDRGGMVAWVDGMLHVECIGFACRSPIWTASYFKNG